MKFDVSLNFTIRQKVSLVTYKNSTNSNNDSDGNSNGYNNGNNEDDSVKKTCIQDELNILADSDYITATNLRPGAVSFM